jgi:hypothetical protein
MIFLIGFITILSASFAKIRDAAVRTKQENIVVENCKMASP